MKRMLVFRLLAALGGFVLGAALTSGETRILLDIGFGIRFVPPSNVTVPAGEYLAIEALDFGPLQWFKNGVAIPDATDRVLVLNSAADDDRGYYYAVYTAPEMAMRGTQGLQLGVKPPHRLVNLSTRAQVGGGEKTFIAGFVVADAEAQKIIIRAVGPSLSEFNIDDPVAHPVIAIFDKDGKPYTNGYYYPQCVGCPTYESELADALARIGAFPLPPGSNDVVLMRPFVPGAYTVHVTSADGTPGVVLLEIYEVP